MPPDLILARFRRFKSKIKEKRFSGIKIMYDYTHVIYLNTFFYAVPASKKAAEQKNDVIV